MPSSISMFAASSRQPSSLQPARQQNIQSAHGVRSAESVEEAALSSQPNQASLCGLPNEALQVILEYCRQAGTQHLRSASLVSKDFYQLADQVKNSQIRQLNSQMRQFLFSAEAKALLNADSLNRSKSIFQSLESLQSIFQIIHAVADSSQMHQCQPLLSEVRQFLLSEEAQACFDEAEILKALQNTLQGMCERIQKKETVQAILHKEALQKILQEKLQKIVQAEIVKKNNLPLTQLIQICLLKEIKRGNLLEAIKFLSARPLPIYEAGMAVYGVNLTRGDLVAMGLCTRGEFGERVSLTAPINGELGLFILTHISSLFTQEQEPDIKYFLGLIPNDVWKGVVETYKECSFLEVQDLFASRVDALVDAEAAYWAIENDAEDLLIELLKNDFNPNRLNQAGESALYCAMKANRPNMVSILLDYGADVSHLLKLKGDIDPLQWAILKNSEKLLKALLASGLDQNEFAQAFAYAEKMERTNMVAILCEHDKNLGIENQLSASVNAHLALC